MHTLQNRSRAATAVLMLLLTLALNCVQGPANTSGFAIAQSHSLSKTEFDVIEGVFHDGLGTFAEVSLANELIALARIPQALFDTARSLEKMRGAIARLPRSHPSRAIFEREIANVSNATKEGAAKLLDLAGPFKLVQVRHTAREYADARAADLRLQFAGREDMPVSVKTDKSHKVAVAEGQTPHIEEKWAQRYFRVSPEELDAMIGKLGFSSIADLKSNYLNVARLVAEVLIEKLGLVDCKPTDFSRARVTDLAALKFLLHQLVSFKSGKDRSRVIVFDRSTGEVKWESILDEIDIDRLTVDRIAFLPSRPRAGHAIASEFGIKIDGRTMVSFQIKHKRGAARATSHQYEFSDITTRLRI